MQSIDLQGCQVQSSAAFGTLMEELAQFGEVRQGDAVLRKDSQGYHMRNSRSLFGRHRHDLPLDTDAVRLEAHWDGFVANLRAPTVQSPNTQYPTEPGWYCLGFDRLDSDEQAAIGPHMEGIYEFTGAEWLDANGAVVHSVYDPSLGLDVSMAAADYYVLQN